VIAGGGFAALETALALRALVGRRAELTLVSPQAEFAYRPMATAEAFDDAPPLSYDLQHVAADLGASIHISALEAVSPPAQTVQLESGLKLPYDVLVLAVGALRVAAVPGAVTFRDQRDVPRLRAILDELATGRVRRLVFVVPSQTSWALPAYELALLASAPATGRTVAAEIAIVTPEASPLAVFGDQASRAVSDLLAARDISFFGNATAHSVGGDGTLALQFDAPLAADRVVALPELRALRIAGIPASWSGFVPTDAGGRVEGLAHVYAAGEITTFPIKQGGLAAQQADLVAHTIADELGVAVKELRDTHVLRARLLTGDGALVLRTELDRLGRPTTSSLQHRESRRAEDLKVFGQYLTPYLATYAARLRGAGAVA
jgi:sulfide:quinone oxidoreductase